MSENFKSSRNPCDMHPRLLSLYARFEIAMHRAGIDYILTSTFRNAADQQALYESGRTKKGPILTNAMPGQSAHNIMAAGKPAACAFDIALMKNGKCDWDISNPNWKKAGTIANAIGLDWAGNWEHFKEYPHFQLTNWKELRNA